MTVFIKNNSENCKDCQRNKVIIKRPHDLIQLLQLTTAPWTSISLEFIIVLFKSHRNTGIPVIFERFIKGRRFHCLLYRDVNQGSDMDPRGLCVLAPGTAQESRV